MTEDGDKDLLEQLTGEGGEAASSPLYPPSPPLPQNEGGAPPSPPLPPPPGPQDPIKPEPAQSPAQELDAIGNHIGARKNNGAKAGQRTYRKEVPAILIDPLTQAPVRLTQQERKIVHSLTKHTSFSKVARHLKTTPKTVSATFKLPAVQAYFRDLLNRNGVTDSLIAQRIKEGMEAVKVTEFYDKESGTVVEGEARPDHDQRGKYIDRALRLQGLDKPPAEEAHRPVINVNIESLSVDELRSLTEALMRTAPASSDAKATEDIQEAEVIKEEPPAEGPSAP